MSEDNNTNSLSIDDIVRELDREEMNIVISKDIKKFNKPTTVVRGLEERIGVQSELLLLQKAILSYVEY